MKMVRLRRGRLGATPPRMSFYVGLCADKKSAPLGDRQKERRFV
ncbi:replication initiation protein [Streptococcus agalactiae]|nr:replication initiation protein [Streptococcus agalactiae]